MTGTSPKQHHFVPRFYLERFTNLDGRVWTLDKVTDKVFATSPSKLARASGFYEAPAFQEKRRIHGGVRVILSVGLARAFQVSGDTARRHWLQVNNLYLEDDPAWKAD